MGLNVSVGNSIKVGKNGEWCKVKEVHAENPMLLVEYPNGDIANIFMKKAHGNIAVESVQLVN